MLCPRERPPQHQTVFTVWSVCGACVECVRAAHVCVFGVETRRFTQLL